MIKKHELLFAPIFRITRSRRMKRFETTLNLDQGDRILDVGGGSFNWRFASKPFSVTLLNLYQCDVEDDCSVHFESVVGDALDMPYSNGDYQVAFSNSVIEHVGDLGAQERFAAEIRRVGRQVWVQTPAKEFFLEPHFLLPFVHWFRDSVRIRLVRALSPRRWFSRAGAEEVDSLVEEVRLLTRREFERLFPDCEIITERFLLMPRCYIAVRKHSSQP